MRPATRLRAAGLLLAAPLALGACGASDASDGRPAVGAGAALAASSIDESVSGSYVVEGLTVQPVSGRQREISGTLELAVSGGRYEVSFELDTSAPDMDGNVPVQVRGEGRGYTIQSPTIADILQAVQVRGHLESLAARLMVS